MFFVSAKSPMFTRIILVQALLRYKMYDVRITGNWDEQTAEAVVKFRTRTGMKADGPVEPNVFFNLVNTTHFKLIKSVDASAGEVATVVKAESIKAGISPLMNQRKRGQGVKLAVEQIKKRCVGHRIALLSMHGHGDGGYQISIALGDPHSLRSQGRWSEYYDLESDYASYIDEEHFSTNRNVLESLKPYFAPFGSVEVNSCKIALNSPNLLQKLANLWEVPVTGGIDNQSNGGNYKNYYGETINATFNFEGQWWTFCPHNLSFKKWAEKVEKSVPTIEKQVLTIEKQMLNEVSNFVGKVGR